jgi:hypothetical protein
VHADQRIRTRGRWGGETDDPAGPEAQALGARWTALVSQLMAQPVDPKTLEGHPHSRDWEPRMASFVDKPV